MPRLKFPTDHIQLPWTDHDELIQAFVFIGLHGSFDERIQIGRGWSVLLDVALPSFEHFIKSLLKLTIVVPHDDRVLEFDIVAVL